MTSLLCKDHAARQCPAWKTVEPPAAQQAECDTLTPDSKSVPTMRSHGTRPWTPRFCTRCSIPCHQLPCPFRADVPLPTFKVAECPVREWVHEADHLPFPNDAKLKVVACQPGIIMAVREHCGVLVAEFGGGEQAVVFDGICRPWTPPLWTPMRLCHVDGWHRRRGRVCIPGAVDSCENVLRGAPRGVISAVRLCARNPPPEGVAHQDPL